MTDRILRKPEVLRMVGVGYTTIWEMMARGEFPSSIQIAPRAVGWRESEILDWLESRPRVAEPVEKVA